jgi:hypothetical protein
MKLNTLAEIGATLGTATLIGLNTLQHKREEEDKPKHDNKKSLFTPGRLVLYSSLFATGLAIWEIRKHHHVAA